MTWFESLTGFSEDSPEHVRSLLIMEGTQLHSLVNDRIFEPGKFSTPSLEILRESADLPTGTKPIIQVREIVADVQSLHNDSANANAVFQVASQFNCLEMAAPHVTPEEGVGVYEYDGTQGPACSICAGAGTIFRNYFVSLNGKLGQSFDNQIDCLADIGSELENAKRRLWRMQNGYCFPTTSGLAEIEDRLSKLDDNALDQIRGKLRVGVQTNTEVTTSDSNHCVTQVFCSALPIAYSEIDSTHWAHFSKLILDATYEATFHIAIRNQKDTGCGKLFLTLVGGGVFGNNIDVILSAIGRCLKLFSSANLDVSIVSHGSSKPEVVDLLNSFDAAI